MIRFLSLFIFHLSFTAAFAQEFGGNPPSVKWRQINVPTARIIFPQGLDSQANRIANLTEYLHRQTLSTIGTKVRKVNIVLQNATTISNAYVALGPFRSEFQLTPQQNSFELGSIPWTDNLAVHEYRHIQQYNNFNRGLSKVFRIFFGEEGQALANGLSVPDWFFEGDAVDQETLLTAQGRGRLPYFFNGYRALCEDDRNYSWMKLRNGSLKDYVPDHYRLGYMLVAYGRKKYGNDFWKKIAGDAASFKGLFYPLQSAVKRHSGISYRHFRNEALNFYRPAVGGINSEAKGSRLTPQASRFHDEEYPQWIDTSAVVYIRSSYDRIPQFVIRKGNDEKVLRSSDISLDHYFSYKNGKIIYAAHQPDTRWGWRDFSDLKIIDVNTGQQRRVTRKTKYFAPDISEDGKRIVAVFVDDKGNSELHLLDENGKLISKIPNIDQYFYTYPKFYSENKIVSAVRNRSGEMGLVMTDIATGDNDPLTQMTYNVIGFPSVSDSVIYFTASNNGRDQLFQWEGGNIGLVHDDSSATGNYQLSVHKGRMVWTKFTSSGYRIVMPVQRESVKRIESLIPVPDTSFIPEVPHINREDAKYKKSFKLLNFHSLRPFINDPDYTLSVISQNILNTLEVEVFGSYNRNEGYKQIGVNAFYGAWFPVIKLGSNYTIDRAARILNNPRTVYWDERENRIGLSVPLNLTSGRTFTRLNFGTDFVYNKRYFKGYFKDTFENRAFGYLNNTISFSNQIQQARKHINPRMAQSILLNYKTAVTNFEANQFLASGSLYLPGAFQTHSLVLQGAFHARDTLRNVIFSNSFPFSRGYSTANFHRMWKAGANYHLPLVYPDWGFADIVYFLRIRANVFYDHTEIREYNTARKLVNLQFRSYGTEIFFDTKWWNQLPVSFGVRYSRLMDADLEGRAANQWEIVLPVNLLSR